MPEVITPAPDPAPLPRPQTLICACCGSYTKGRQWFNRDNGYGLCAKCWKLITADKDKAEISEEVRRYGVPGYNHSLEGAE